MMTQDSTVLSSASLFPPNKPSKRKALIIALCTVGLLGGVIGTGYLIAHNGKPLATETRPVSPLDVGSSVPVATIPLPPETASVPVSLPQTDQSAPDVQIAVATPRPNPDLGTPSQVSTSQSAPSAALALASVQDDAPSSPSSASSASKLAALEARQHQLEDQIRELQRQVTLLTQTRPGPTGGSTNTNTVEVKVPRVIRRTQAIKKAPIKTPPPVAEQQVAPPVPTVREEQLVAIDYWAGKPSVVLKGSDGKVHFASEGESIASGRIGAVHAATGTVTVVRPDGSHTTLQVREAR